MIVLASGPDHDGVYLDGKLIGQGHWMTAIDLLSILEDLIKHKVVYVDGDWLNLLSNQFPDNLADIVEE